MSIRPPKMLSPLAVDALLALAEVFAVIRAWSPWL
jgi:hypothetical protein